MHPLLALLCVIPPLHSYNTLNNDIAQVVIFDAGSSGTRVHVYDFLWENNVPRLDIQKIETQTKRVRPGLSSLADLDDMAIEKATREIFTDLLIFAKQFVPLTQRQNTPVILKATAGMRLVSLSKSNKIMNAVRQQLGTSDFLFRAPSEWAAVIRGSEEAGLAWVAANYLNGTLNDAVNGPTYGVVEMGGASSQVSFEVQDEKVWDQLDNYHRFEFIDFYGHQRNIYAMSYLGFGRDHAYLRLDSTLADASSFSEVNNPCHRKGYSKEHQAATTKLIKGTGDYTLCVQTIEQLLFNATVPNQPPYLPGTKLDRGALLPTNKLEQVAMTEVFYYVRQDLIEVSWIPKYTRSTLMDLSPTAVTNLGNIVCSQIVPSGTTDMTTSLENSCFTLGFQATFLKHIGITSIQHPKVVKDMNGAQVEWAMGAAIQHLSMYRRSSISLRPTGAESTQMWSFGETIIFAVAVTFAILGGLVVLAKVVYSSDVLSNFGRRIFLGGVIRAARHGRRKAKNSDLKSDRPSRRKYNRVQTEEMERLDQKKIPARGPTALKWKTSDDGFQNGNELNVV